MRKGTESRAEAKVAKSLARGTFLPLQSKDQPRKDFTTFLLALICLTPLFCLGGCERARCSNGEMALLNGWKDDYGRPNSQVAVSLNVFCIHVLLA